MNETVIVQGAGGAIFEMDIPVSGFGRERFDEQITNGDLLVLPASAVRWVEDAQDDVRDSKNPPMVTRRLVLDPDNANATDPGTLYTPADPTAAEDGPVEVVTPPTIDAPLSSRPKPELFDLAAERGIETKASWNKAELLAALGEVATPEPGD